MKVKVFLIFLPISFSVAGIGDTPTQLKARYGAEINTQTFQNLQDELFVNVALAKEEIKKMEKEGITYSRPSSFAEAVERRFPQAGSTADIVGHINPAFLYLDYDELRKIEQEINDLKKEGKSAEAKYLKEKLSNEKNFFGKRLVSIDGVEGEIKELKRLDKAVQNEISNPYFLNANLGVDAELKEYFSLRRLVKEAEGISKESDQKLQESEKAQVDGAKGDVRLQFKKDEFLITSFLRDGRTHTEIIVADGMTIDEAQTIMTKNCGGKWVEVQTKNQYLDHDWVWLKSFESEDGKLEANYGWTTGKNRDEEGSLHGVVIREKDAPTWINNRATKL